MLALLFASSNCSGTYLQCQVVGMEEMEESCWPAPLVQDGIGIGLYTVRSSLPGPRGGPDECATIVRVNGGALGAGAGCGFTREILVDGVRSCCRGIPLTDIVMDLSSMLGVGDAKTEAARTAGAMMLLNFMNGFTREPRPFESCQGA